MDWKTLEAHPKTWKWVLFVCGSVFVIANLSAFPRVQLDLGTIVSGIGLVALYGLAYERAIWSRKFWKVFFWVFVSVVWAFVVLAIALTVANTPNQFSGGLIDGPAAWLGNLLFVLIVLSVFGIQMRGVYLYSYKRQILWAQKELSAYAIHTIGGEAVHKDALKLSAVNNRTSGCARRRLTRAWNRT